MIDPSSLWTWFAPPARRMVSHHASLVLSKTGAVCSQVFLNVIRWRIVIETYVNLRVSTSPSKRQRQDEMCVLHVCANMWLSTCRLRSPSHQSCCGFTCLQCIELKCRVPEGPRPSVFGMLWQEWVQTSSQRDSPLCFQNGWIRRFACYAILVLSKTRVYVLVWLYDIHTTDEMSVARHVPSTECVTATCWLQISWQPAAKSEIGDVGSQVFPRVIRRRIVIQNVAQPLKLSVCTRSCCVTCSHTS
jgi:hypothetical protein